MTNLPVDLVEIRRELLAAVARDGQPRARRVRVLAPAIALAIALLLALVVPPTRAEIADAVRTVLNGGSLPGSSIPAADLPNWLRQIRFAPEGEPRVLAEVEGQEMFVFRQASGSLCFEFGGVGICNATEEDLFGDDPVALFGPTLPTTGTDRFRLWGLALASVERVEVTFSDAPPRSVPVHEAFGIALDATSSPETLVVYGANDVRLATLDLTWRWRQRPAL